MHWSVIESEQGKYNWKEVDDFVNRWTKAGKRSLCVSCGQVVAIGEISGWKAYSGMGMESWC